MWISDHSLNPALLRDLEARYAVTDLLEWLDVQAEALAKLGLRDGEPVRFSAHLLRARKVLDIRVGTSNGEDASILTQSGGYVIQFRANLPKDRRRFSIAHEIGHTYWFDSTQLGKPLSPFQSNAACAETVERLCNFFAGALLLPRNLIRDAFAEHGGMTVPPLHLIPILAERFAVAEQAVARRLFFQLFPCKLAIVRLRLVSADQIGAQVTRSAYPDDHRKSKQQRWQISWCTVPAELRAAHSVDGLGIPLLDKKIIPNDMIPSDVSEQTRVVELDGRWWEGITPQGQKMASKSFKNRRALPIRSAFACRFRLSPTKSLFAEGESKTYLFLGIPLIQ